MLDATDTTKGPLVAPVGIVKVMDVALQELIVATLPFRRTTPLPAEVPKPVPEMTTWLPTDPVVAEKVVIAGADVIDKPSNVPVYNAPVLPLLTARPA